MIGLTHCVDTIYKGQRSGSYLFVKNKPNITILAEVHSKKLIIDEASRECKGVTVIDSSGAELSFYATHEVILSQGVFESPKLLMLSGIGPKNELSKHGIDTLVDSRHVGQNLLDHPGVPFVLKVKDGYGMDDHLLRRGPKHDSAVSAFNKGHAGPMGSGLLEMPNINLNFFADDLDIIAMREGIRFSYDILTKGKGFKDVVLGEYPWEMPLDSDEEMHHAVLDRCQTAFHPCGTARLSKDIDQGVVDPKLKVHGISKLRVIDASVMPVIPDCRIQNSVYMVGEKGADMIKAEHKDLY
ncbi:hypothetical protein NW754_013625 [Fusarium falciforme]|nr:hypothetical protein NW754_013625 [Fusarium falciforme]